MSKYLYNDVELPALPEYDQEKYPYAYIIKYSFGGTELICSDTRLIALYSSGVIYPCLPAGGDALRYELNNGSWLVQNFYTPFDYDVKFSYYNYVWSNTDVLDETGNVVFTASNPTPVPVVGLEWKKHDAYKPNIEWGGKTFYRVMGKKWVKQDAVVPAAAAVPVPDNCLIFSSSEPFTVATYYKVKSWDGALYYSTNGSTWSEWDGTTDIASAEHGGEQRIYMRGSGNSKISRQYYYPKNLVLTGNAIACSGNIETLLDHETVARGEHPTMAAYCFNYLFDGCTALTRAPELPATTLSESCYSHMFYDCTSLLTPPELPASNLARACYDNMFRNCKGLSSLPKLRAITLSERCYASMFYGCTGIKLSETQTEEYKTEYRMPISGTGTTADYALIYMFTDTGGTFTGEPTINTTYYTSNTVV